MLKNKYIHFILGLLFTLVAFSAFLVVIQFSKGDIISLLEICATQLGAEAMPADLLKTAKIIRHKIWDFHIIGGFLLVFIFMLFSIVNTAYISKFSKSTLRFFFVFKIIIFLLVVTAIMHLQTYSDTIFQYKQLATSIHFYLAITTIVLVFLHILEQIAAKHFVWDSE